MFCDRGTAIFSYTRIVHGEMEPSREVLVLVNPRTFASLHEDADGYHSIRGLQKIHHDEIIDTWSDTPNNLNEFRRRTEWCVKHVLIKIIVEVSSDGFQWNWIEHYRIRINLDCNFDGSES